MPSMFFPEMKPVPEGATQEELEAMYQEYKAELQRMNPSYFNADGTRRSFWGYLKRLFSK